MSRHGYPRPQLERKHWTSLNGEWDFALDPENAFTHPNDVKWSGKIEVPFAPETQASGIGNTGFFHAVWYRRTIEQPRLQPGSRTLLHFGAVDYKATVWINGCEAVTHEGGYTPFTVDLSPFSKQELLTIVVRAIDDPSDLSQPRGKQDWQLEPHSIWYPRTTGIWQTVWMETVPSTWIGRIRWTPNLERWELGVEAWLDGARREGLKLGVKLSVHRVSREWIAAIARDTSHPCIVAWVPINESWGVPNLPTNAAEWDMLAGIVAPELGGHPRYLDIMGVNFYHSNQQEYPNVRLRWEDTPRDPRWQPLHHILAEVYDWNDENHWHNSGLWDLVRRNGRLERVIHEEYAEELRHSQALLARCGWGNAPEHDVHTVPPAVGLEQNLPPVYSIAVHGE